MNAFADSLFTALMSWVHVLVNDLWAIFSTDRTTILEFLGKHWIAIVLLLLATGLVLDWLIWLIRWQPYHLWAQRARRMLRIEDPQEDEQPVRRAHAARMPERPSPHVRQSEIEQEWLPLPDDFAEQEQQRAMEQAQSIPDTDLRAYPGMRYGANPSMPTEPMQSDSAAADMPSPPYEEAGYAEGYPTAAQRGDVQETAYPAQTGDAQAERQRQQEEIMRRRQQAEAAEQARWEQEQLRYELEMAEYNRQMEQYRLEMAEYERQKAAYDAQMAAQTQTQTETQTVEQQQERLRRTPQRMPAPEEEPVSTPQHSPRKTLMNRVVHAVRNLEPEESEVHAIVSLPPRVDKRDAYAPAAHPPRGRRLKK